MSAPCLPVVHRKKRRRTDEDHAHNHDTSSPGDSDHDDDDENFQDIQTMDATEYLSRVVSQAKKLSDVFVAPAGKDKDTIPARHVNFVPIDGSAASLSYLVSGRASLTRPPSQEYLPKQCSEWTRITLASFEHLRDYLEDCRSKGIGGKLTSRTALPPMKDRSGWHMFCVGSDEANGNTNSYFGDDYNVKGTNSNADAKKEEEEIPEWSKGIPATGHAPSVRLLVQMDQVLVRRVIAHLSHYTNRGWKVTAQRCAWLYALLARLEKPVHRDDASNLFGLLKVLTRSRSKFDVSKDKTDLARLNVLITVIGVYFEQGANVVMAVE